MQIVGGWLADRFGPRLILFLLCVIWSVSTVLTGMVGGAVSLLLVRLLVGIGEGGRLSGRDPGDDLLVSAARARSRARGDA